MAELKHIAVLGSTGSIGTQALEVIAAHPDRFVADVLTAQKNAALLISQAQAHKPHSVVIGDESQYGTVKEALWPLGIQVYCGQEALAQITEHADLDIVLTALVGFAGLEPTLRAIRAGKHIALANKETLVVAGELVTDLARREGVNIYPVDSEHSAIFQCMAGEWHNPIEKIYLTASGGPFRGKTRSELADVTREQALRHPNWNMGAKITVDSATLMNKGLEVIEAKWLFNLLPDQIDVIVHPQSIIHSIVQFSDGSMKAQMGLPDMKLPIQYALGYPERLHADFPRLDFSRFPSLTFENPDRAVFRCLDLAYDALRQGGNSACILNAANEVAVDLFLKERIVFAEIAGLVERTMDRVPRIDKPSLSDYLESDEQARRVALELA